MIYNHLRGRGFEEGKAGVNIYRANIIVDLTANQADYKLEENSPVERAYMVGLWVTDNAIIINQTKTQADGAIFNSAYLNLRVDTKDVVQKVYLHQVQDAQGNGRPFYLFLPGRINLSESKLVVPKNDTIAANTVLEFQVDYAKPV